MNEQIIARDELINLFKKNKIQDTKYGWVMDKHIIEIIALHSIEPKYLQDITRAENYKIVKKTPISYYKT
ncbi:MAG: hypothetical protein AB7E13_09035 [Arcobacteraceae bacterium]